MLLNVSTCGAAGCEAGDAVFEVKDDAGSAVLSTNCQALTRYVEHYGDLNSHATFFLVEFALPAGSSGSVRLGAGCFANPDGGLWTS